MEKTNNDKICNTIYQKNQIFTPKKIIDYMLKDTFKLIDIKNKYILEPSCGNGNILVEIVNYLIKELKKINRSDEHIIKYLNEYIYAVEIDEKLYNICKNRLNETLILHGIKEKCKWENIILDDFYDYNPKNKNGDDKKFDIIIGNPPYITTHDLGKRERNKIKKIYKATGRIDSYIAFYIKGLNMLTESGALTYITPNSFLTNISNREFMKDILNNKNIYKITNFNSCIVFPTVKTYTAIMILTRKENKEIKYIENDDIKRTKINDILEYFNNIKENDLDILSYEDINKVFNNYYNVSILKKDNMKFLLEVSERKNKLSDIAYAKYGMATNADDIFISSKIKDIPKEKITENLDNNIEYVYFGKNKDIIEKKVLRKIIKGSKVVEGDNNESYVIFPYIYNEEKNKYILMDLKTFYEKYPATYRYLKNNETRLKRRDIKNEDEWYGYARSQGLEICKNNKLVISQYIKEERKKINICEIDKDTFVYAGFYIKTENINKVKEIISSDDFFRFALLVSNDKNGNYKEIRTKTINQYKYD